jgi:hypothetical protein
MGVCRPNVIVDDPWRSRWRRLRFRDWRSASPCEVRSRIPVDDQGGLSPRKNGAIKCRGNPTDRTSVVRTNEPSSRRGIPVRAMRTFTEHE